MVMMLPSLREDVLWLLFRSWLMELVSEVPWDGSFSSTMGCPVVELGVSPIIDIACEIRKREGRGRDKISGARQALISFVGEAGQPFRAHFQYGATLLERVREFLSANKVEECDHVAGKDGGANSGPRKVLRRMLGAILPDPEVESDIIE